MPLPTGPFYNVVGTPAAPQFARIVQYGHTLEANGTSKPLVSIYDLRATLTVPGGSETTLQSSFSTAVQTAYLNCTTVDYNLDTVLTRFMDDPTNAGTVTPVNSPGGVTDDRGPSFQAAVMRKITGVSGRNFRGSTHHGAIPETFTTKDNLNATGITAFDALKAAMVTLLSGISDGANIFYPIVLSPTLSVLTANPRIFTGSSVQDYAYNLKLGTMKRRKEKG